MQQFRDPIFYNRDTPIQLGLPWQSYTSVSILTLKPLLRIIGVLLLKSQAFSIVSPCI